MTLLCSGLILHKRARDSRSHAVTLQIMFRRMRREYAQGLHDTQAKHHTQVRVQNSSLFGNDHASSCRFLRLRKYVHQRWSWSSRSNDGSSCEIAATLEQSGVDRAIATLGFCFLDLRCLPSNVVFHALHSPYKVSFSAHLGYAIFYEKCILAPASRCALLLYTPYCT